MISLREFRWRRRASRSYRCGMDHKMRWMAGASRLFWIVAAVLPACDALAQSDSGGRRQSLTEAWWTGPILAASAATLPPGHLLVEPCLYDAIAPHTNGFGSLTFLIYGLADRFSVGLIPTFGFNAVSRGPSSSRVGVGDLSAQAQYRLTQFHPGGWIPTISVLVKQTFPTGQYDRLGDRPSDGFGAGAYTTTLALYSQTYLWLPNGRILRARLDVSQSLVSSTIAVRDVSVFGTAAGFYGHARPGASTVVDLAGEYSVTRRWVLALDAVRGANGDTRVMGSDVPLHSGSSTTLTFAPAIEYNMSAQAGVLTGVRLIEIGHNFTGTVTPVIAVNVVY
jgi:hypothetical protein